MANEKHPIRPPVDHHWTPELARAKLGQMKREVEAGIFIPCFSETILARESVLARLGYRNYENYRSRSLWKKIKQRIAERDRGLCFRCGGKPIDPDFIEIHHRCYCEGVMRGNDDSQLVPLCRGCHDIVEFDDNRVRRTESEKDRVLHIRDTRADYPKPKIDMRRNHAIFPPDWERMNARQRAGWLNEYRWFHETRKFPNLEKSFPEYYNQLKSAWELTKANARPSGRDVPILTNLP